MVADKIPIVLFDGICRFCDASVNWIIDHDPQGRIRFAALQSDVGQKLLERFGLSKTDFDSLVLVEGERCWCRSDAALGVARHLPMPWSFLSAFLLMPAFLRDPLYGLLAANRYNWFGQFDACRIPTPEVRARFLE
jgi:predicted DCC family thiol-disulfide oxidoreductase YuxK